MEEQDFFGRILLLPLFQGISKKDFLEIAKRVRLHFQTRAKGRMLVRQDELCNGLYFILNGEIGVSKVSDQKDSEICEWLNMPLVLQPEALFGLNTRYTRSFYTCSAVQLLYIDKAAVRDILLDYPTIRINFLNLMSYRLQSTNRLLWRNFAPDLEARFIQYLTAHCIRPAGRKELRMGMVLLAKRLDVSRKRVSEMLNNLEDRNLLEIRRGKVIIPCMEQLLMK